jgi:ubiquinone/menaquinone biosynthesis C-methylase UbiE
VFGFGGEYKRLLVWSKVVGGREPRVLEDVVGGSFDVTGQALLSALKNSGLKETDRLIDVGCGLGRLSLQLKDWPHLDYVGFDVVPELLAHAAAITQRPDWRFEQLHSTALPLDNASADMICFFSVFTHLKPPTIKAYLAESRRVLKPSGRVVLSFLDPTIEAHKFLFRSKPLWRRLVAKVAYPLNVGFTREELGAYCREAGLKLVSIESPHPIGQSMAVFEKAA